MLDNPHMSRTAAASGRNKERFANRGLTPSVIPATMPKILRGYCTEPFGHRFRRDGAGWRCINRGCSRTFSDGLRVTSGLKAGGIYVNNHARRAAKATPGRLALEHRKRIAAADRLLAAEDVRIERRERLIERVRAELGS